MAIIMTRHEFGSRDVLGAQQGAAISVANGAASATLTMGLYRIYATDNCTVRIDADAAAGGMPFAADMSETFYIREGMKVAVAARP